MAGPCLRGGREDYERGSDEGKAAPGLGGGGSGAAGSHAPRPRPGHARGSRRLLPLGARDPPCAGPGRARSRSSGCPVPGAARRPSVAPALRDGHFGAPPLVLRLARMCRAPRCFRRGCPGVSVSILLRTALMASPSGTSDPSGSGRRLTEQFSGGPPSAEAPCSEAAQFPTRSRPYVHGSALPLWHEARAAGVLCRSL